MFTSRMIIKDDNKGDLFEVLEDVHLQGDAKNDLSV